MNRAGAIGWLIISPHCFCSWLPGQICVLLDPPNVVLNGSPASLTAAGTFPLFHRVPVAGWKV